ncbi:hypothetical protein C8Q80DRAFT_946976 [Daedaleopsis nitida]|nr:hypothetical protein C8Q80DRAFT_946976 [Daedaleopsis nitida]
MSPTSFSSASRGIATPIRELPSISLAGCLQMTRTSSSSVSFIRCLHRDRSIRASSTSCEYTSHTLSQAASIRPSTRTYSGQSGVDSAHPTCLSGSPVSVAQTHVMLITILLGTLATCTTPSRCSCCVILLSRSQGMVRSRSSLLYMSRSWSLQRFR